MFNLQSVLAKREIYFHEDDYCQQELLPREALAFADAEIKKIGEFANAHRAPDGAGWTDVYVRQKPPVTFRTIGMTKENFGTIISPHLPPFDLVYTGYSSYRERCRKAAAWGTSQHNALFADWDDEGIIRMSGLSSSTQMKNLSSPQAKLSQPSACCTHSSTSIGLGAILAS